MLDSLVVRLHVQLPFALRVSGVFDTTHHFKMVEDVLPVCFAFDYYYCHTAVARVAPIPRSESLFLASPVGFNLAMWSSAALALLFCALAFFTAS